MGFQEKIERVNNRHLGDKADFDAKFPRRLRENQARKVIRLRILLPVDKMLGRLNPQRIAQNPTAAVRRGSQAHHLGPEVDQPIVMVVGDVVERDVDRHAMSRPDFTLK